MKTMRSVLIPDERIPILVPHSVRHEMSNLQLRCKEHSQRLWQSGVRRKERKEEEEEEEEEEEGFWLKEGSRL